jgi:hypothetical protein
MFAFIFNLVAMSSFAVVILIPSWQAVLAGAVLFISWSAISLPATMSLLYNVLPQNKRTMGVTMHSPVRRNPIHKDRLKVFQCLADIRPRHRVQ